VFAGLWTHADIVRDVFNFADLIDAHEFLDVREENKARAEDSAQASRNKEAVQAAKVNAAKPTRKRR